MPYNEAVQRTDDHTHDPVDVQEVQARLQQSEPYTGAPFLPSEPERLRAVAQCMPSDIAQEPRFTQVGQLIGRILDVPIGLVVFISSDATWAKGSVGVTHVQPTDRRWSLCTWILLPLKPEALVVEDLSKDARFSSYSLVSGPPHLRFYAAVPLVTSTGFRLGTVCAIDFRPRTLPVEAVNWLCNLSELVVQEIESSLTSPLPGRRAFRQSRTSFQPVLMLDMQQHGWKVLYGTRLWPPHFSSTDAEAADDSLCSIAGGLFWDMYAPMTAVKCTPDRPVWHQYNSLIRKGHSFQLVVRSKTDAGQLLCLDLRPGGTSKVWDDAVDVGVSSLDPITSEPVNVRNVYFAVLLNNELSHGQSTSFGDVAVSSDAAPATAADAGPLASASLNSGTTEIAVSMRNNSMGSVGGEDAASLWQPTPFPEVDMGPLLGQGAYGKVYLGVMQMAPVAIKVIPQRVEGPTQDAAPLNTGTEGAVGLRLQHPNVIRTHMWKVSSQSDDEQTCKRRRLAGFSFGQAAAVKDHTWIVLEYCDKGTLQNAIDKGLLRTGPSTWTGGPDLQAVLNVAQDIAAGMEYLHNQGVLHGDLNPKNVLLAHSTMRQRPTFTAKVCDFGMAREYDGSKGSIATHSYGTVTHMPTELVTHGRLTRFSDVYAFGVMLWELYTGQRPFAGFNAIQLMAQRILSNIQLTFDAPTPEPYRSLAERCMSEDASKRPTFTAIVQELEDLQQLLQQGKLQGCEFPVWGDPQHEQQVVSRELASCGITLASQHVEVPEAQAASKCADAAAAGSCSPTPATSQPDTGCGSEDQVVPEHQM